MFTLLALAIPTSAVADDDFTIPRYDIECAGVEGSEASLAILNKGTPSYQITPDKNGNETVLLSVLRSPSVGTYLHEPDSYSMTDYDRMRDPGHHHFEFAFTSYSSGFSENSAVTDAATYNSKLFCAVGALELPEMPTVDSSSVRISAVKSASDKRGFIMRLCEYHGKESFATVSIPSYVKEVYLTDLKEDTVCPLPIEEKRIILSFEPFKIKTLRFII